MLEIKKFTFNPFQENTYVVNDKSGKCFIVDPGCYDKREEEQLADYIESENLEPVALVNTHCHVDHVFGNDFVYRSFNLKPLIHPNELPVLKAVPQVAHLYGLNYTPSPEPAFYDGDEFIFGDNSLKIINLPGHSPGHIGLYHEPSEILIGGDVLFRMSIGRTDLPGGNHQQLLDSIREKVFTLPDQTRVLPGHMEETTVEFERMHNPFF